MATSPTTGASGDEVGRRTFSTSFRGFDQGEVRAYLEMVAAEFTALQGRVSDLEAQLEEATRPAERPSLDAATLTSLVGEETARVLRAAQQAADDLRTRAEEGAARTLTEAHEEAARARGAAEVVLAERTAEAEKSAAAIGSEAQEKADKLVRDAKAEADRITHDAIEQGRDMVSQAQAARERVLGDLARRRRSALSQLEQLQAGRERLEISLSNVRAELDRIHQDLAAADAVARQAAEVAARSERRQEPTTAVDPGDAATKEQPAVAPATEAGAPAPDPEAHAETEPGPVAEREPEPEQDLIAESKTAESEPTAEPDGGAAGGGGVQDRGLEAEAPPEPSDNIPAQPEAIGAGEAADQLDRTADALQAEEALISAAPRNTRRPKVASTPQASAPPASTPVASTPQAPTPPASTPVAAARPTYVHDPVPTAIMPTAVVAAESSPPAPPATDTAPEPEPAKVDELFARIRADRAVATEDARATLAIGAPGSGGTPAPGAGADSPDSSRRRKRAATANHPSAGGDLSAGEGAGGGDGGGNRSGDGRGDTGGDRGGAEAGEDASAGEDRGLEAPRTDAEETYLQRRDVLVEVVQATTVRALRRSLADDQNAALDKFRTVRGDTVEVDALLGGEDAQVRSWSRRAAAGLADGAAAGAHLASGGSAPAPDAALVAPIADRLGAELVGPLRARLAAVLEAVGRDRGSDTVDRINSVFREWRSRIDRAVGDAVTEAVSAGFAASAPAGSPVAWVVEDLDGPCPDCDDNALAGSIPLGEPFPTGQTAPPAHPGCRCVLTRTPA